VLYLFVILLMSVGIYWSIFWLFQNRFLFPTHKVQDYSVDVAQLELPKQTDVIHLEHSFGHTEIHFVRCSNQPAPTVLVAHGQVGLIDSWHARMQGLLEQGYHYCLVEFPGYGRSEGKANERTLSEVFVAAYDYLVQRDDVDATQMIGLGRSMGGGVISLLATQRSLQCLWLLSTFTSVRPFFARRGIPGFLLHSPLDNRKRLRQLQLPTLLVHGYADNVIPVQHARDLAAVNPRIELVLENGDHDTTPQDWDEYWSMACHFHRQLSV